MCCLFLRKQRVSDPPRRPFAPRRAQVDSHSSSAGPSSSGLNVSYSDFSSSSSTTSSIASGIKEFIPEGPIAFHLSEICAATDNFSPTKQIGRSVWKATLRGLPVAISKKIGYAPRLSHLLRKIHSLHHSNLIRFRGACREGEHLYLVYDLVDPSSLSDCLRSKHSASFSALSSWLSRLQVAVDIAKGIEYLHHHVSPPLIHKHINSRNILVSDKLRAKIAHVGASALTGEIDISQTSKISEDVAQADDSTLHSEGGQEARLGRSRSIKISGIQGYMPNEYLLSGEVTPKYDVFSFGVVLAELLTGKQETMSPSPRPSPRQQQGSRSRQQSDMLNSIMSDPDPKGKLRMWMDPLLKDSYPLDDALRVAAIARSCMHPDPEKRPHMSDVASSLLKYLTTAEKWEVSKAAQREMMSVSLQPR